MTEGHPDVLGVFQTQEAAMQAVERTTAWGYSVEPWTVEAA
ncbi:hypothetical protein VD659_09790 [Herbiconiux sp. 11R-BC]